MKHPTLDVIREGFAKNCMCASIKKHIAENSDNWINLLFDPAPQLSLLEKIKLLNHCYLCTITAIIRRFKCYR